MSSKPTFSDLYWQSPELTVKESINRRCTACSRITYSNFRADDPLAELFRPRTIVIGSFLYVTKSAFAGCWVCRLLLRQIVQAATSLQGLVLLNRIDEVVLKLSLDDELTLSCQGEDVDFQVCDLGADVIELEDGEWCESGIYEKDKQDEKKMVWSKSEGCISLADCDHNRLILNPDCAGPELILHWLFDCMRNHENCWPSLDRPKLPTRILDVGDLGESRKSRLIVTNGLCGQYLTLSHCWGKTHHTMALSHENMKSLMVGIDDSEMPKTFQEAIMITRGLGQRYLWIDSMCIIQPTEDDNSDWEKEGAQMGNIYRNSLLTIAASSAHDNTEGCLSAKPASQFDVHPVPLFDKPVHREWDEFSKIMSRNPEWFPVMTPKAASWLNHVQNAPLSSRAWVLQERLLSPRTLHCTIQGFFWECSKLRASEYEPLGCAFDYFFRDQGLLNTQKLLAEEKDKILGSHWRKVVERYTQLGLSVATDRLPALAGLAQIIQEHTKDTYIAGHWKSSLISSLLWFRLENEGSLNKHQRQSAPSWSWASISGEIKYTSLERKDYPTRDIEGFTLPTQLVDFTAEPLGSNVFSWTSKSSLKLRGRLRDASTHGGLPEIEKKKSKSSEAWRGFKPVASDIGQLGSISMPSRPKPEPQAASGATAGFVEEKLQSSQEASPASTPVESSSSPEESSQNMASVAADHTKLQQAIKESMTAVTSSQQWEDLEEGSKAEKAAEIHKPKAIAVIYDDPSCTSETHPKDQLALLEILRAATDNSDNEGLVLLRPEGQREYQRIGFFRSKVRWFDQVDEVVVELV